MTFEQKQEIVFQAAQKLRDITRDGFIAGGYPRDVVLGAKPKDIDIFIDGTGKDDAAKDALADAIYAAFGQTWTKDRANAPGGEEGNPAYAAPADPNAAFQVYYMATTDRSWEPVNIIFSHNNNRGCCFDWSICCVWVDYVGGNIGWQLSYTQDDLEFDKCCLKDTTNMDQAVEHAKRIREKYPEVKFRMPHRYIQQRPGVYEALLRGGIFDIPGEILPAQGQNGVGNQVGLNLGERPGVGIEQAAPARPVLFADYRNLHQADLQARIDAVVRELQGRVPPAAPQPEGWVVVDEDHPF